MLTRARAKLLRSLRRREARRREGLYLVEGERLVAEALRSGAPVQEVLATSAAATGEGESTAALAVSMKVRVVTVSAKEAERISDTRTPQGIFALVRIEPSPELRLDREPLSLALDGVADPGNVGTILRAADAFGVRTVVAGPETADFLNPKTQRAAMGSAFRLELHRLDDLTTALAAARKAGVTLLAATLDGVDVRERPPGEGPCCLVLGNEARGVSAAVREAASEAVTVHCPGAAESLNVAMAGAILLFHLHDRVGSTA